MSPIYPTFCFKSTNINAILKDMKLKLPQTRPMGLYIFGIYIVRTFRKVYGLVGRVWGFSSYFTLNTKSQAKYGPILLVFNTYFHQIKQFSIKYCSGFVLDLCSFCATNTIFLIYLIGFIFL